MREQPGEADGPERRQGRDLPRAEGACLHQGQHQRADPDHQQDAAEIIEAVPAPLSRLGQEDREHRDRENPDRQVDPEHDRPVHVLHEKGAERRPDDRGEAEHRRRPALHPGPLGRGVDIADHGHRNRLDRAGAEALDRPVQDQHLGRAGKAAQQRADEKDPGADKEHALAAIDVGGTANTQLNSSNPPRLPTIVGRAVATMLLSTAGMNVAISAAIRIRPRRGTTTDGRVSSAIV